MSELGTDSYARYEEVKDLKAELEKLKDELKKLDLRFCRHWHHQRGNED